MATSGSKSVSVTSWDTLKFSWWFNSGDQSVANNTTLVRWKLELIAGSSGMISSTASKKWSVTVNGTTYSGTNTVGVSDNSTKVLASGTTSVAHNADGSKSFAYSFSQEFGITFSGSSIGTISGSSTGTLNSIPRASSITANNGTLGKALTIGITKASTAFTHTVTYTCGSVSGTIATKTDSTSISWTPPVSLAAQSLSGMNVAIVFTCTTFNGNTQVGTSTKSITCALPTLNPSCSLAVGDQLGYTETYGAMVQGQSRFSVVVTGTPNANSKAKIKSYLVTINGVRYTGSQFVTDVISWSGTKTITATVTDEFGNTASDSVSVTVLPYVAPITKLTCRRCDADGTANDQGEYISATCEVNISVLNNLNSSSSTLKCKKSSDTAYTTIKTTASGSSYFTEIFAADTGSSYDVVFEVKDDFSTVSRSMAVSTGYTIFHISADGTSMSFGKVSERKNADEFAVPVYFNKGLYDEFNQEIRNGLAYYLSGGAIDCNTTLEELVLSGTNTPDTSFWFVRTHFYAGKTETSNRMQMAMPYNKVESVYYRYYNGGSWSEWVKVPVIANAQTSGIWTFTNWADGRTEMYGKYDVSGMDCNTALGGLYRTAVFQPDYFPFTVIDPKLVANYESDGYGAFLWATTTTTTTKPPSYYLVRPTSATIASGKIIFHVSGRWK